MNISSSALITIMLISVLITFVIVPLVGTTLLWLTTKLWQFKESTFKNSFKTILIPFGVTIAILLIFQNIFVQGSVAQFAQSSPASFLCFLVILFVVGIIVGVISIKKFFQESFAKSIGVAVTFFVFAGILFFIFVAVISIAIKSAVPILINEQAVTPQSSVQNNSGAVPQQGVPTGVQSQQTIIAKQSTLLSGASMAFIVAKYPQNATLWSLRVDCAKDVTAKLIGVAPDLKTPVGGLVNCNQDIALDKDPYAKYPQTIIFSMKALNSQKIGDETLIIVSKTFDTAGTLLNQSSFPVAVQAYTEGILKNALVHAVFQADNYIYTHTQGGYTEFCTSHDPQGLLGIENELKGFYSPPVCKDSQNAWAVSVQLKTNPSQYWCADNTIAMNTFAPIVRSSPISTISCK